MKTPINPIDLAIEYFGGQPVLAEKLGIKPQAISQWRKWGFIPKLRIYELEELTNGRLNRRNLRSKA